MDFSLYLFLMPTISHFFLPVKSAQLSFLEWGEGDNILLCTHGYRQEKEVFLALFPTVPTGWKILSFDQPMHGTTEWKDKHLYFDKDFFPLLWEALYARFPYAKWNLMGFSMGGKTAIMMQMCAKIKIERLILLAPGGIYTHPLNRFFTYSPLGKPIFRFLLKYPSGINKAFEFAYQRKWMRTFSYRFVKAHFSQPEVRSFLYTFSYIYQYFDFSLKEFSQFSSTNSCPIYLFWGTKDDVVSYSHSNLFLQFLPHTKRITIEGGHNFMEENKREIQENLTHILSLNT
jgi:pimeloyl-ACP methyl ester carboxylesterase